MIESVAWGVGIGTSVWAVSSAVKSLYGKRVCALHDRVILVYTSDIAMIKSNFMLLTAYIMRKADEEGIDLQKKIIESMMKKGDRNVDIN
jgi:hypothetical protein